MKISAVIPTRNRASHVSNLLTNLQLQTYALSEIIVVDSSDNKDYKDVIFEKFSSLPLVWIDSEASVCIQRNKGIRLASSPWIFLCDDDIRIPNDYIEQLVLFIKEHPECSSASGLFMQNESVGWVFSYPFTNFGSLLWAYIFKLSVWGSVDGLKVNFLLKPLYNSICKFYEKLGNHTTTAGWPVITKLEKPYFRTKTYSLGSSITRKSWLQESPYDEILDPSGIGDNYGVTLGFPDRLGLYVTHNTYSYNYRASENRLNKTTAYFRRILALHYFLSTNKNFTNSNRRWFIWSLVGNLLLALIKRRFYFVRVNFSAINLILRNKNPYLLGKERGMKVIKPFC